MAAIADEGFFAVGEIVKLRSGGPSMTVESHDRKTDKVSVSFWTGSTIEHRNFVGAMLASQESRGDK